MPDPKRTIGDIARDLNTLRKGTMPTGAKAPDERPDRDPVEDARLRMLGRRNRGELTDVNLPGPATRALVAKTKP
jgi:hypothetical protein